MIHLFLTDVNLWDWYSEVYSIAHAPIDDIPVFVKPVRDWLASVQMPTPKFVNLGNDSFWAIEFENENDAAMFRMKYPNDTSFSISSLTT
jgi:hypothetical protein